jgi:predicted RNA-binding protein with PUA-like domain
LIRAFATDGWNLILMQYWLMKSEPAVYSIADLQRDRQTLWDGVRNYQARNFLKSMQVGDRAFFYHSNATPLGIVGLMQVSQANLVDPTQFDPASKYYDAKSTPEAPRWHTVQVEFVAIFPQIIALDTLRQQFSPDELLVVQQGNRLSVMPVTEAVAQKILTIAQSH